MLNSKVSKAVRLAFAFGAASTAAFSANTLAADEVERIEVTGSSIKRTDLEGALPIDVISAADIAKTGVTSVPDLIATCLQCRVSQLQVNLLVVAVVKQYQSLI